MPDKFVKEFIENAGPYAGFGAFGGIALYLNKVRNGTKFRLSMFIVNIILSGWIGIVMHSLIPDSIGITKIGLISISGFLSYPILSYLEDNGLNLLIKRFLGTENIQKK